MKRTYTKYPSNYIRASENDCSIVWKSDDGNWTIEECDLGNGSSSYTVLKNGKRFQTCNSLYKAMRTANVYARGGKRVKGRPVRSCGTIEASYDLQRRKLLARGVVTEEELDDMTDDEVWALWEQYQGPEGGYKMHGRANNQY